MISFSNQCSNMNDSFNGSASKPSDSPSSSRRFGWLLSFFGNFERVFPLAVFIMLVILSFQLSRNNTLSYYRDSFRCLCEENDKFKREIVYRLVPDLRVAQSNLVMEVMTNYQASVRMPSSSSSCPFADDKGLVYIDFSFCVADGIDYISYRDFHFRRGDFFWGAPIIDISPFFVRTTTQLFVCKGDKSCEVLQTSPILGGLVNELQ